MVETPTLTTCLTDSTPQKEVEFVGYRCKNKYCPDFSKLHEVLVRGYCADCASIRKPSTDKTDYEEWAKRDHKGSFGSALNPHKHK